MVCTRHGLSPDRGIKPVRYGNVENRRSCRWKSHSRPDGNRQAFSHRSANSFPTALQSWRFTHSSTTPAAAAIHPFLSNPKRENKQKKKRERSQRIHRRPCSRFCYGKVLKTAAFLSQSSREKAGWENHKGMTGKCRHRRLFCLFPTLIPAFFQALGLKLRTLYHSCPKTLLATVGTAHAEAVVLPSAVLAQEESPLHPPFFAAAHRSPCS